MVKTIKIKNPITQEFHGAQGIYTQRNMEKMRSYNLPQWKALCEQTENQPPAKRGEKRLNADRLLGRGSARNRKSEGTPNPDDGRRSYEPSKVTHIKEEPSDHDSQLAAPPTPTSPDVKPSVPDHDHEEHAATDPHPEAPPREPNPTKEKGSRKPVAKPRGRQPKATPRKDGNKGAETSVAARRLRNDGMADDEVDEEAFRDFDYRAHDGDQWTAERCDELEDKYWKSLSFSNPMYGADMPGSLFDDDTKEWNVAKLPNLLDLLGQPIPGVNTTYLYLGMWRATYAWHLEDVDLYSINYIHFGAPKQWYSVSQRDAPKFEAVMKSLWSQDAKDCDQFLRHKTYLVSPSVLKSKYGINVNKVVHREGQFVITFPIGYHSGYNLGYNCAESVNFAIENWIQYGKTARKCKCEADSVFIDVDWFIRRINGEPTPEYEEIEVTDDEDEFDDHHTNTTTDLPTPPGSDRGKIKVPQKRKRSPKDHLGSNKRAKKIIKIRKVSKHQPCCLCPNDFSWEELLPTSHGQRAHRTCAMYTPETYIATRDGREMVFNVENISKARLELKCYECRQKKGSCFQCSSAKCTKSYHATCAMQAGVQVDKGEIAVWHEGVEYRDIGFDWRCRLHRTVKRTRITSELSACNHANSCWSNREFKQFLLALKPGELIQYQATNVDEIEAGLIVAEYDEGQNAVLVQVLPEQYEMAVRACSPLTWSRKIVKEIEPSWILFVDSTTSCLQKPSANALDLPEELQGKTASLPDSTERKPSEGDPFTEDPKTEWAEFISALPPTNTSQKAVDLSKDKQVWLYLGSSSTDSKAQYTADPDNRLHDPASHFLDTVEPPKPVMAPPPQPRRQALAASYPMVNVAARNAAMANARQQMHTPQGHPLAMPPSLTPSQDNLMNTTLDPAFEIPKPSPLKSSQYRDILTGAEARANEKSRILQRQQAKAQQSDTPSKSYNTGHSSIGIDREAVERQKQFQTQASQHARHMTQWSSDPSLPALRQYPDRLSDYNALDRYGGSSMLSGSSGRHQPFQYSHEWMSAGSSNRRGSFGSHDSPGINDIQPTSLHMPPTSPPPLLGNTPAFPPYVPQSHLQFPYEGASRNPFDYMGANDSETVRIENIRAAANQPPRPPLSAEIERQRRISNPAYPFKSPDQIKAQKEAEKRSPPGSRPSSSYTLSSPVIKQEGFVHSGSSASPIPLIDPQNPPQFINPNATQISPPASSTGRRSASRSFSGTVMYMPMMEPPMQPQLMRTLSSSMPLDSTRYAASPMTISTYVPRRSIYDPLHTINLTTPQNQPVLPASSLIAQPAQKLLASLEKRRIGPNGLPINDMTLPKQLTDWQEKGGFWGRVAGYYIQKHQAAANVYRSPFAATAPGGPVGSLADRYCRRLTESEKAKIDRYRSGQIN